MKRAFGWRPRTFCEVDFRAVARYALYLRYSLRHVIQYSKELTCCLPGPEMHPAGNMESGETSEGNDRMRVKECNLVLEAGHAFLKRVCW